LFFERPEGGESSILVHIDLDSEREQEDPVEFEELVRSSGADPVAFIKGSRKSPDARVFVGSGKLAEIAAAVQEHEAELVLFNHSLSPSQERNLEKELKCRVLDRTGLILDIFAQRARTHEGKLQVELAMLQHTATRLKRGWTHLDRQKGGVNLRGAGETQLEMDQRMIRQRIKNINKSLAKVRAQREQGRRSRKRAETPVVSLVGYTNAGKSSVFNTITSAGIYAADQLFATLDATLRRIQLPSFGEAVLVDTVGFNERFWFARRPSGMPHTVQLHLMEKISRPDHDTLHYEVTIDDPGAYTRPWTASWDVPWSEFHMTEYFCQDNNVDLEHIVGPQ